MLLSRSEALHRWFDDLTVSNSFGFLFQVNPPTSGSLKERRLSDISSVSNGSFANVDKKVAAADDDNDDAISSLSDFSSPASDRLKNRCPTAVLQI